MADPLVVVCPPELAVAAEHMLREQGFCYIDVQPDPGMVGNAAVVWFGDEPQVMTVPRHALRDDPGGWW